MARTAFLDTGVVLGYCFTVDHHHSVCRKYLESNGYDFFISPTVEDEYENTKPKLNTRYSESVLRHVSTLEKSEFEGELGPMDMKKVREDLLSQSEPAYPILCQFYEEVIGNFANVDKIEQKLRTLSREIEKKAEERKNEIDRIVRLWNMDGDYPNIRKAWNEIHEPDRTICIEAHDLAVHMDTETELATVNPNDYTRGGRAELIENNSAIERVLSLV